MPSDVDVKMARWYTAKAKFSKARAFSGKAKAKNWPLGQGQGLTSV